MRAPSADAVSLAQLHSQDLTNAEAYREPGKAIITLLPKFADFNNSDMKFTTYHGMKLANGGEATLFQVITHEHGHVLDMHSARTGDAEELFANHHVNELIKFTSEDIRRSIPK